MLYFNFAPMLEFQVKQKETGPTTFNMALHALRIVFMGTPEFAVASLDALVKSGYHIAGVVTAPDKPAGRGMKLTESPVKKYAIEHKLKILQPEKLKNALFLEQLRELKADIQVVVAFRMLPEAVWNMPAMGTINLHGSLLPQYRGAAPINWAVINGETETGVTTFKLQHEIDTGNILLQEKFPIGDDDTAGDVHDTMKVIGAQLLVRTVKGLVEGTLQETPQSSILNSTEAGTTDRQPETQILQAGLKHAPKIFTETCKIDFTKSVDEVHNLIRGLSPFPGAFTELNGKMLKIYRSRKERTPVTINAGYHETDSRNFLKFACKDGYIHVLELQLEGKKRLPVQDFLRGYHFV